MSTIKVLHVIARMNVGGTARYVSELVEKIPDSFLATGYVQGSELEDPITETLTVFRIPHLGRKISPINDFKSFLELRKLVRELKPEIIHTHTFKAGVIGRLIRENHKHIHTYHGHLFYDQSFSKMEMKVITLSERYLASRTNLLISVGERVGSELRMAGIGKNMKWLSIPPGVVPLPRVDKEEARRILNLEQGVVIVGWMARMTAVKNPYLMLEVARAMPEIKFAMAGGGDLLEEIRRNAPSNVSIIGWADASIFWSSVDCAISTSDNEGMPIALIEAQLAGIPVVVTDVGSSSEVVEDGVTGIVTSQNIDSLVKALTSLILNDDLLNSMSVAAQDLSCRKFSLDEMLNKHLKVYSNN